MKLSAAFNQISQIISQSGSDPFSRRSAFSSLAFSFSLLICASVSAFAQESPVPPAPADVAAPPADARKTPSGLATKILKHGSGSERPADNDCARLVFTSWTRDGGLFTSSHSQGGPMLQCLRVAMPGVAEALKQMAIGEQ